MLKPISKRIGILAIAALFLFPMWTSAQRTIQNDDDRQQYLLALELFEKEKYEAAREKLEGLLKSDDLSELEMINAKFLIGQSAAELYQPDARQHFLAITTDYPGSIEAKRSAFELGKLYYRSKGYSRAVRWFESTDIHYLNNDEITEYHFKAGYSYYRKKNLDQANLNFHKILNIESRYQTAAKYYYSHIAYQKDNLETALTGFQELEDSKTFGKLVPYYITQIYFEQGKYEEAINYAAPKLYDTDLKDYGKISRLVAEAHYQKGDYEAAAKYFDTYSKYYNQLSREDYYQMAYCNYNAGNYEKAIEYFEKVVGVKDGLAQNAYYHLADCFVKTDNKKSARNAFQFASKIEDDKLIQEEAMFNYAKLTAELAFQSAAIKSFRDFKNQFPESTRKDEANELLAEIYLSTKNYKDALIAMDEIKVKSPKVFEAYQKVAYYRGVENYNDRKFKDAITNFNKALGLTGNPQIDAMARYWKGETYYKQKRYDRAADSYNEFLKQPAALDLPYYNTAHYNIGYCYFTQRKYEESLEHFRRYVRNPDQTEKKTMLDARIRIGDGFFISRRYNDAIKSYDLAINGKAKASDYCVFQKGMIKGLQGDQQGKVNTMNMLASKYSNSNYRDDALYEKGSALMALSSYSEAESTFNEVLGKYPNSSYAKKSLLKTALIHYNKGNDQVALNTYKKIINKYPSTPESYEALIGVKNIYVNQGNSEDYFDYVKTVSFADLSTGVQDSVTYQAAEQRYMLGNVTEARDDFDNYLKKFPKGYFVLNATFYRAECDYRNSDNAAALAGYEAILSKGKNIFTEKSLAKSAGIKFEDKDFSGAVELFARLESEAELAGNIVDARAGQMRCYDNLQNCGSTVSYADKLISTDKVTDALINEAYLMKGRCALKENDLDAAERSFVVVSSVSNSAFGAESKYSLAAIEYLRGNYQNAEKKIFDVINQVPSYEFWIAKSFILLADNYMALGDEFQAKHTLQSVIDNYKKQPDDKEDIIALAKLKLKDIDASAQKNRLQQAVPDSIQEIDNLEGGQANEN